MRKTLTIKSKIIIAAFLFASTSTFSKQTPLILISIDGYRYDYNTIYSPPTLSKIEKSGLKTKSLVPIYPSKTFPNHYAIITGLNANKHGIISNSFKDSRKPNETFKINNRNKMTDGFWYEGEPFWNVVNKNGYKSASFFWVGSEAKINGSRPTYFKKYDSKVPGEQRVDQVISWLEKPETERPVFITLYFSQVDSSGHKHGPLSKQVKDAIYRVDDYINRLLTRLKIKNIKANILIVSDHGMREISQKSYIKIPDIILKDENIKIIGQGALALIYTKKKEVIKDVVKKLKKIKNLNIFSRNEIPKSYKINHKYRSPDILVETHSGYYLTKETKKLKPGQNRGTHGYSPMDNDMHGILLGIGPNIKKISLNSVKNVDIFPFMAKLLNLEKVPMTDGKLESLIAAYRENLTRTGK